MSSPALLVGLDADLRARLARNEAESIRAFLDANADRITADVLGVVVGAVFGWSWATDEAIAEAEARRWLAERLPSLVSAPPSPAPVSPDAGEGGAP